MEAHFVFEAICILVILYLLVIKSKPNQKRDSLTEKEENELIADWEPQPLVPLVTEEQKYLSHSLKVIESAPESKTQVNGVTVLNFASANFLGLASRPEVKARCTETLKKYGCGSCGPRGFYGTIDVHTTLESKLASFLGTEEAILYSDSLATVTSVIPAFSKMGDLVILDEGCNYGIQTGVKLSRSKVTYFKHNDVKDLQRLLEQVHAADLARPPKPLNRRLICVEGIYQNYGDICPLPKIVELAQKYKFRLMLDDTLAIGVLGKTGRGTCEYFGVKTTDVDLICGSTGGSLGSAGGFCAGDNIVVDHQRLSALGYCFSASQPPFLTTAAITCLELMQEEPALFTKLMKNANKMRDYLIKDKETQVTKWFTVTGDADSPVSHLRLKPELSTTIPVEDLKLLGAIMDQMLTEEKVLLSRASYIPQDRNPPPCGIRISVSAEHTDADLKKVAKGLCKIARQHFQ
eukprot:GILJ01002504.1.p1 GENE.GILJ01002504.1~~GILJ01002504.1.p1  ORF type:complete len:513 (+),score=80.01 GILJ01002504.1:153-1541(+)